MKSYIALDLETTGLSPVTNEIIEIGAWKVENGIVVSKFNTLVKPMGYVNSEITRITGITNEMLSDSCTIDEILPSFYEFCKGYSFLGHNVGFDYSFLCSKGNRMMLDFTEQGSRTGIDTCALAQRLLRLPNNKLKTVAEFFNIQLDTKDAGYHRASYDAYITKLIYDRFFYLYPNVAGVIVPEFLDKRSIKGYGKAVNKSTLSFE